jgi:hypothetical protein
MKVQLDRRAIDEVNKIMRQIGADADKQIKIAIGKTAAKVKLAAARKLRDELKAPTKVLKKAVRIKRPKNPDALTATILLSYGYPIPLKYFGAKQIKRGVTYKIDPKLKGKSVLRDAFIVQQYRGNVFRRSGKQRGPLVKQFGPAPGEVYEKAGVTALAMKVAEEELPKQINERVRFLIVKAQGRLRGKQK